MKTYYLLPVDQYGQPNGNIIPVQLTKKQYEDYKKQGKFIYEKYIHAAYRSQD